MFHIICTFLLTNKYNIQILNNGLYYKTKKNIADAIGSLKKRAAPLPPGVGGASVAGVGVPHPRSTPSPSADAARSIHGVYLCTFVFKL